MIVAINRQLNFIRRKEQQKLLDSALKSLKTDGIINKHQPPDDVLNKLNFLIDDLDNDSHYDNSLDNYPKLTTLLSRIINKKKRINLQIEKIAVEINQLKELQEEGNLSPQTVRPGDQTQDAIYGNFYIGLDASIKAIKTDLQELTSNLVKLLPEQPYSRILHPFYFLNKETAIIKGMVSVIVIVNNEAECLKKHFDSFLKFNSFRNFRYIIVDKASTDNSIETARSYQGIIPMEILTYGQKFTNSYLYNLAIDSCISEFILLLSVKTTFQSDILTLFTENLSKKRSNGIIGASITGPDFTDKNEEAAHFGSIKFTIDEVAGAPDIPFPMVDPAFLAKSGIETSVRQYRNEERVFIPPGFYLTCVRPHPVSHMLKSGLEVVPALSGLAMFFKRADFITVEGFDLNYLNGLEDVDLSMKFALRLNKNSLLSHDIVLGYDSESPDKISVPDDEIIQNYNLGTLVNNHGYYIKYKYLSCLIENNTLWTNDTVSNILKMKQLLNAVGREYSEGNVDLNDIKVAREIKAHYLAGIRDKKLRFVIKIPAFNNESAALWGDFHFAHSLKNALKRKGYPARVELFDTWHEQGYMTDDVVIVLRGIKRYYTRGSQINIMWNISHPDNISNEEYHDYDHVFVASDIFAEELRERSGINAESLLQCTDPELFFPDSDRLTGDQKTDILYVANSRGIMRKSVEYSMLKGIPVTIYGTNWENLIPESMVKGNYINNHELRKYYSNCTILLNDHWTDMAEYGYISNRIFDAMACGTVVLTDRVKGMKHFFEQGLFFYTNADEFAEQINWIREHYQEAKKKSLKNSEFVLKNHTFDHRAERILEVALKIHQQKTNSSQNKLSIFHNFLKRWLPDKDKT